MAFLRWFYNRSLPVREGERRLSRDAENVLFRGYTTTGIADISADLGIVSQELADPVIQARLRRVERWALPTRLVTGIAALSALALSAVTLVDLPDGTYRFGNVSIRTGDAAEVLPPMCFTVEDDYLEQGLAKRRIGTINELEDQFPLPDACTEFDIVFAFEP